MQTIRIIVLSGLLALTWAAAARAQGASGPTSGTTGVGPQRRPSGRVEQGKDVATKAPTSKAGQSKAGQSKAQPKASQPKPSAKAGPGTGGKVLTRCRNYERWDSRRNKCLVACKKDQLWNAQSGRCETLIVPASGGV